MPTRGSVGGPSSGLCELDQPLCPADEEGNQRPKPSAEGALFTEALQGFFDPLPPPSVLWRHSLETSLKNRYLWANLVYLCYSSGMLAADFMSLERATINHIYLVFGIVHVVNAWMYVWSWRTLGWGYLQPPVLPEYLNVAGSLIYLCSAALYPHEEPGYDGRVTWMVHYLETTAAAVEVLAALGWVYSWYLTYVRIPGRGWTLDDPDQWANLTIVAAAATYLSYNVQILQRPEEYGANKLYHLGDVLYFVNSIFYTMAALRDDGWFWWMPLSGQLRGSSRILDKMVVESLQVPPEVASGRASFQGRRAPVDSWYVQEEEVELEVGDEDEGQGHLPRVRRRRTITPLSLPTTEQLEGPLSV